MTDPLRKPLTWMGGSRRDLIAMPVEVRKEFGVALDIVQQGQSPNRTKLLKGGAAGAVQLSEDHRGDTYRAIYTVQFEGRVYVLHCFQKKSKQGIATSQKDMDLIATRLAMARNLHTQRTRI